MKKMFVSGLFILIANSLDAAAPKIFKGGALGPEAFSVPQQRAQDDAPPTQLRRLEVETAQGTQSPGFSFVQQRIIFDSGIDQPTIPELPESTSDGAITSPTIASSSESFENRHIIKEPNQSIWRCSWCNQTFTRKDNAERHANKEKILQKK